MKRFFAIFVARNLEFFRDRATFFWNLLFPLLLIFGFAFAFSGNNAVSYKIGTIGSPSSKMEFLHYQYLQFIPYTSLEPALKKLSHHQIDMVLDFPSKSYYINKESQTGYVAEKMLLSDRTEDLKRLTVEGHVIRYIDWFVPGVIGMNIMFGCLVGVGFVIIRYRHNGVLKRFKATPIHAIEFITAQVFSRFFIVAFMTIIIYAGANFFLHFQMNGSYFDLALVACLAIICLISMGLLFASRVKSEEAAGGIMNIIVWPMMMLSGIWFSLEGTPKIMQDISKIFPTTHFVEASRKIMLDGANLSGVMDNIIALGGMALLFLVISAFVFKWE
jgi:ABC-type multidrug transport system permease subunit